ncbi:hypothetical protein C8R43DRAFT_874843, partial [Mycena crocata]
PPNQASITSLHNAKPKLAISHLHGIILTNLLPVIMQTTEQAASGIFPSLSRANHDCRPNANYYFHVKSFTGQFRAMYPISEGEEITIQYTTLEASRETRRADL